MRRPNENEQAFATYLSSLAGDSTGAQPNRAALAALRRGLSGRAGAGIWLDPHVGRFIPDTATPWEEQCYYLVASLFALHGRSQAQGASRSHDADLGTSLARYVALVAQETGGEPPGPGARLVALLNARQEDVPAHLRHIVSLLASREVPIDWACLLCHLKAWNREDRDVQRAWSRSFWGRARGVKADDGQTKAVAGRNQPAEPVH